MTDDPANPSSTPTLAPPPRAKLSPADLREIRDALVEAYSVSEMRELLLYNWGLRLDRKLNLNGYGGSEELFGLLLDYTEREGRTLDLLGLAWSFKRGNDYLRAAVERLLPSIAGILSIYDDKRLPKLPSTLEAIVKERSRIINFQVFLKRCENLAKSICRVETPFKKGTGFLIGDRTVLTNYHVVQEVIANRALGEKVICRFDHTGVDLPEDGGTPLGLTQKWLGPYSPYSQSDLTGTGQPSPNELDFAVLHLADPVVGREPMRLSREPKIVIPGDVAMIAQHPEGDPLAIASGVVVEFPADGLRYRYDCTTKGGSSGAPMLTADLELAGLHHAAEPDGHPKYNQAIPTFLIARAIAAQLDLATL